VRLLERDRERCSDIGVVREGRRGRGGREARKLARKGDSKRGTKSSRRVLVVVKGQTRESLRKRRKPGLIRFDDINVVWQSSSSSFDNPMLLSSRSSSYRLRARRARSFVAENSAPRKSDTSKGRVVCVSRGRRICEEARTRVHARTHASHPSLRESLALAPSRRRARVYVRIYKYNRTHLDIYL